MKSNFFKNKKNIIILCISAFVCLSIIAGTVVYFTVIRDDTQDDGQYNILELTEGKIPESHKFAIVDEDGNTILTNADVNSVLVSFEKSKDRYLEIRLTEAGAQKFKDALEDGTLSIMLNGKKLTSPVIADDVEENSAIVLGEYEKVMEWFNEIT